MGAVLVEDVVEVEEEGLDVLNFLFALGVSSRLVMSGGAIIGGGEPMTGYVP